MEQIGLKIKGSVRYFQRDNLTGLIVPETEVEDCNVTEPEILSYEAYKIGTNTIDQAIDNRFTVGGTVSSGDNGYDGIAISVDLPGDNGISHKLDTDINAGGTNSENYIEFSGSIAGQVSVNGYLHLGYDFQSSNDDFTKPYAYYALVTTIESGRTFYFYWKLTIT